MHAVDYVVGGEKNHGAFSDDFAGASQSPAEVTKECQLGSLMEIIIYWEAIHAALVCCWVDRKGVAKIVIPRSRPLGSGARKAGPFTFVAKFAHSPWGASLKNLVPGCLWVLFMSCCKCFLHDDLPSKRGFYTEWDTETKWCPMSVILLECCWCSSR